MSVADHPAEAETRRFGRPFRNVTIGARITEPAIADWTSSWAPEPSVSYVVRFPADQASTAIFLSKIQSHNLTITDSLEYWSFDLRQVVPSTCELVHLESSDSALLEMLVRDIFQGYRTHWHYNPETEWLEAAEAYVEWMQSVIAKPQVDILALIEEGQYVGFIATEKSATEVDVLLAGIRPEFQGRGFYQKMFQSRLNHLSASTAERLFISTQASNIAVKRSWARIGLTPRNTFMVCHLMSKSKKTGTVT